MSVDKRINYDIQGGVKNYLGKQPVVNAPKYWQSSPDHPTTELAYITPAEKDLLVKQDLHGSLKGGVNRGPAGIMSLNGWGSADESQNVSGSQVSAAETGGGGSGMTPSDASDFRSAAINAGAGQRVNPGFFDSRNTVSPAEMAAAKAYRSQDSAAGDLARGAYKNTRGGWLSNLISGGGILGAGIRGLGQKFGLGKRYNQPTYDMSEFSKLGLGGVDPTVSPNYYNDFDNELMLSTEETPSTLDLSKLETGDLNNIESLIKASEQPKAIAPDLMAKVVGPALIQMRTLEKKEAMSEYGGEKLTPEEQLKLDKLKKMDADQDKVYNKILIG